MLWAGNASVVYWFPAGQWDYKQMYFYEVFNLTSYLFIFLAMWLYVNSSMRKDKDILLLLGANFINQVIDLPHFLICRRASDLVVIIQASIICYASVKILFNQIMKK